MPPLQGYYYGIQLRMALPYAIVYKALKAKIAEFEMKK